MDSILRGYPIEIVLLWETYTNIQFREFQKVHKDNIRHAFLENRQSKKKLVLDGQQRIQSLYIALYGSYEGKHLYFDVLSGRNADDFEEDKYLFYFATPSEAKEWNKDSIEHRSNTSDECGEDNEKEYFCNVSDWFYRHAAFHYSSENDEKLRVVAAGIMGIYFNVDSFNSLGVTAELRRHSKQSAFLLIDSLSGQSALGTG